MTALTVEDGSGLSSANCYASQADALAYFSARGVTNAFTAATSDNQIAALLNGCRFIDSNYLGRWKGSRFQQAQALAWPRMPNRPYQFDGFPVWSNGLSFLLDVDGYPVLSNQVPQAVKAANCEAAALASADVDLTAAPGPLVKMRRAGDTEEEYVSGASLDPLGDPRAGGFAVIDRLLEPFLISMPGASFGNVALVRC